MSIPKIAISNEDDAGLYIVGNRFKSFSNTSNTSSPYKSIIKTRSSQPQSPSTSTTQSFHTCRSRLDSARREFSDQLQIAQELRTIDDALNTPARPRRSCTISFVRTNSDEDPQLQRIAPRERRSYSSVTHVSHRSDLPRASNSKLPPPKSASPLRRAKSYHTGTRRVTLREGRSIEQGINRRHSLAKRRSTLDHVTCPPIQKDAPPSVYGTPIHEAHQDYVENCIRLVIETDVNTQIPANDRSDMQLVQTISDGTSSSPESAVRVEQMGVYEQRFWNPEGCCWQRHFLLTFL